MALADPMKITAEHRELALKAASRIKKIADDLIQNTRSESLRKIGLINSIEQQINDLTAEKRLECPKEVEFELDVEPHLCEVVGSPKELDRILSNLINNSIEASKPNEIIRISAKQEGDFISISIADKGRGIPEEVIPQLGQFGFSYGKSDHNKAGMGLGLYHAMKTLKSWTGDLKIRSQIGNGTVVTLYLRISTKPSATEEK